MTSPVALTLRILCGMLAFVVVALVSRFAMDACTFASHVPTEWTCSVLTFSPVVGGLAAGALAAVRSHRNSLLAAASAILLGLFVAVPLNYLRGWYGSDHVYAIGTAIVYCFIPAIAASSVVSHLRTRRES